MPTVANNDGSLDPKYERELKQNQYEKVLKIMKWIIKIQILMLSVL